MIGEGAGMLGMELLPVALRLLLPAIPNPSENLMSQELPRRQSYLPAKNRFARPLALNEVDCPRSADDRVEFSKLGAPTPAGPAKAWPKYANNAVLFC